MSTASPGSSAFSTLARRARDGFLLSSALRGVSARPADRQELIRTYHAAALDRTAVADRLTDERGAVAALLLYREAMPLLVGAIALAHDPDFQPAATPLPENASPWEVLADLHQRGRLPALPAKLEQARAALTTADALTFDRLSPQTLLDRRNLVERTVRRLQRLIETRTPSELKASRYARIVGLALVTVVLIYNVASSLLHPNLALKKPVTASSRHPDSVAPVDNSGLTNGVIETTYGVHTAPGPGWVTVDLQKVQKVSEVKLFNRRDALFDAGLPLTLETSSDGKTFTVANVRTQSFSSANPWVYEAPPGTKFRFLRISSHSMVALTEVEVY